MNFSKSFARQPRALMIAEIVASLLVIALLDSITSYQIRLLPFYAVPVFVLAWFCGKTWGIAAGLFSALLWWCANRFTGDPDLHSWIGVWEVSRHVGFFLIVALVGSALRAKAISRRSVLRFWNIPAPGARDRQHQRGRAAAHRARLATAFANTLRDSPVAPAHCVMTCKIGFTRMPTRGGGNAAQMR
jgi:hypothetical protein